MSQISSVNIVPSENSITFAANERKNGNLDKWQVGDRVHDNMHYKTNMISGGNNIYSEQCHLYRSIRSLIITANK